MATFGERVKILRQVKGMTQRQMADEFGITERNYQRYEAIDNPTKETLIRLADFFGVTTDYLLGRSEAKVGFDTPTTFRDLLHLMNSGFDSDPGEKDHLTKEEYQRYIVEGQYPTIEECQELERRLLVMPKDLVEPLEKEIQNDGTRNQVDYDNDGNPVSYDDNGIYTIVPGTGDRCQKIIWNVNNITPDKNPHGYIVQVVCLMPDGLNPERYLEAWKVEQGQVLHNGYKRLFSWDDEFSSDDPSKTATFIASVFWIPAGSPKYSSISQLPYGNQNVPWRELQGTVKQDYIDTIIDGEKGLCNRKYRIQA